MKVSNEIDNIVEGVYLLLKIEKREYLLREVVKSLEEYRRSVKNSNRRYLLDKIANGLYDKLRLSSQATIITPVKLTKPEKSKAEMVAKRLTNNKAETFEFMTDADLIDGMKVLFVDKVWDLSLAGKIEDFKKGVLV